jgi:hypothetical protein
MKVSSSTAVTVVVAAILVTVFLLAILGVIHPSK